MASGDYYLQKNNGTTLDEKIFTAVSGKALGFNAALNPVMLDVSLVGHTHSNYVPYTGATADLYLGPHSFSVNGGTFTVNKNNNCVGINTTNPNTALEVYTPTGNTIMAGFNCMITPQEIYSLYLAYDYYGGELGLIASYLGNQKSLIAMSNNSTNGFITIGYYLLNVFESEGVVGIGTDTSVPTAKLQIFNQGNSSSITGLLIYAGQEDEIGMGINVKTWAGLDAMTVSGYNLTSSVVFGYSSVTLPLNTSVEVWGHVTSHGNLYATGGNSTQWNSAYTHSQQQHWYLPLSGGSMYNMNVVTNLNADLLDGQHGSYYATASSLSNYVPYTGATSNVNLGLRTLTTYGLQINEGTKIIESNFFGAAGLNFTDNSVQDNSVYMNLFITTNTEYSANLSFGHSDIDFTSLITGLYDQTAGLVYVKLGDTSGNTQSITQLYNNGNLCMYFDTSLSAPIHLNFALDTNSQISSSLAQGTAPFTVVSTTVCSNLNADLLDGNHASDFSLTSHTHSNYDNYVSWDISVNSGTASQIYKSGSGTSYKGVNFVGSGNVSVSTNSNANGFINVNIAGSASYTHPSYTVFNPTLSGALVLASLTTDAIGSVTAVTTRTLTLANLGYTGATNATYFTGHTIYLNGASLVTIGSGGYLNVVATNAVGDPIVTLTGNAANFRYDISVSGIPNCTLTGYLAGATGLVAATDSLKVAFSKLQYQMPKTLYTNTADVLLVGTTPNDFYSYTLPANTLSSDNQRLELVYSGSNAANPNGKTIQFYFGGISYITITNSNATSLNWYLNIIIIRASSSTLRVSFNGNWYTFGSGNPWGSSINFATTNVIKLVTQGGASSDIIGKLCRISHFSS
jgi:hypothetical protein